MKDFEIKKIPYNTEAEKAVIGGIFLKQNALTDIAEFLSPDDFYNKDLKIIYAAILELYNENKAIDPILILEKNKNIKNDTFYEVIESVQTAANVIEYAHIVMDKAKLRNLQDSATKIVEMTSDEEETTEDIIDRSEALIFKIAENNNTRNVISIKDMMNSEFTRLQNVYDNKGTTIGISSGFTDFDQMTNGFNPSDLVILAARPAMGKTAFALNLALNAAKTNKSILIFSLEMSSSQLLQRFIAIEAGIGLQKIRTGFLSENDWGRMGLASETLMKTQLNIADLPNATVMEIRTVARRMKAAGKLDMILIDYLQLIKGSSGKNENRQQEISDISRSLKGIARELDVPIIALSQLSRATEQRADRRPMLSDLRESGAIEQDADMVAFLYRDDYYNEESEAKGITEIIIGKQRNGPVGTIKLRFFHELTKFANYTNKVY
ncbi:replicative DNA helicase [Fusobacterium ulcerans]|uniref:Replicative DNA helicase n=1 Tax=Fusobacterium ulcerans TaxID=861 RepID=A0AAX2JBD6_9FUSO|nr:replicative DNA helicase [Fusobacterium ulcerans]AVQ29502.1 replicative DNA helicase [Fusobacterium ulcerans]EFS26992.1 replicative DNA helicase [Fusobacterium ulcerans ATCC 49185]SQJ03990.1 Replicative DNA helicase [Fusobacterium ulcerans]